MKSITEIMAVEFKKPEGKFRKASELDAIIGEIEKVIPMTPMYGYGYWRGQISRRKVGFGDMLGILKELSAMAGKYNKAATLVNILKKFPKKIKTNDKKKPEKRIGKQASVKRGEDWTQSLFDIR